MRFLPVLLIFLFGCGAAKTDHSDQDVFIKFSVLLEDNQKPEKIAALTPAEIKTARRISKTQNLWMITPDSSPGMIEKRFKEIKASPGVLEVQKLNADPDKPSNSKNIQKAETTPIK